MIGDKPENPTGLALIAADHLSDLWPHQIDDYAPTRPPHMDMIVGVDDYPQTANSKNRGHRYGFIL